MRQVSRRSMVGGMTALALGAATRANAAPRPGGPEKAARTVRHVVEKTWHTRQPTVMFPDLPQEFWDAHPEFWDPAEGRLVTRSLTWVLRRNNRVVLVDTGIGNDKERPGSPDFHQQKSRYLELLGIRPEKVDLVINTHLHTDHVGWNTRLDRGRWVPTFPNATYLFPEADYEHFRDDPAVEDSVTPVIAAGQAVLWRGKRHRVDRDLVLESAPGHTPGASVLKLRDRAVFLGDLLHNPAQLLEPATNSFFCLDPAQARASRARVLDWAADTGAAVHPTHFPGGRITRTGHGFRLLD
ncbi:MBL fold metallo-hydrolase [Streptomyces sp. NPDC056987]|uniref:MBL fold metallo-hydrolase n=1 Tax=Streptomyces sp. NPDC056987 TaxID=3345988 RepID=UPI0036326535